MKYSDEPIANRDEDFLGRSKFIVELAQRIIRRKTKAPLVIGLNGRWGDGKTSALNLLNEKLEKKAQVVRFDPWYFSSQEELLRLFFATLFEAVLKNVRGWNRAKLKNTARKFVGKLSSFPISINYGPLGVDTEQLGKTTPEEDKNEIKRLLAADKKNRKYVVLIDNLDRLQADELLLILKLIRLCGDFPNFVYILAFDFEYVSDLLNGELKTESGLKAGEEYLKKIIQFDSKLPEIELNRIDVFLNANFEEIEKELDIRFNENFQKRFGEFYLTSVRGKAIRNMRDAKKFLNSAFVGLSLVRGEVNYADWLVLELVRVFSPLSYSYIYSKLDFLVPQPISRTLFWDLSFHLKERQDEYQEVTHTLKRLTSQAMYKFILAAMNFLFPFFAAFSNNFEKPDLPGTRELHEAFKGQQISAYEYRDAYFLLVQASGQVSDIELNQLVERLNTVHDDEFSSKFRDDILKYKSKGTLKSLFEKLMVRIELVPYEKTSNWIHGICANANSFDRHSDFLINSEEDRAQALVFSFIDLVKTKAEVTKAYDLIIRSSQNDQFTIDIVLHSERKNNQIVRNFETIDLPAIKSLLQSHLREKYINHGKDIFSEPRYGMLLHQWAGPLLDDRVAVQNYLDDQFRSHPENLGKFLEMYVQPDGFDEGVFLFTHKTLAESFDAKWLIAHIKKSRSHLAGARQEYGANALLEFNKEEP